MDVPVVFPLPRRMRTKPGPSAWVRSLYVQPCGRELEEGARTIFGIAADRGLTVPEFRFSTPPRSSWTLDISTGGWSDRHSNDRRLQEFQKHQGYALDVSDRLVRIRGASADGALNGVKTLAHLFTRSGARAMLRPVSIRDWPHFKERGCFFESYFGTDLMSLDDWKRALEKLHLLKLNTVCISLYNCWTRARDLEFLFFRSRKYPQLKTGTSRYDFPTDSFKDYKPRIYSEDFLPELIAYAGRLGINVIPYFSSLGHNTYLPKMFPDISMKDESGKPLGYGFCTENPDTYRILFELYDEIIERCMAPFGLTDFHLGMDEIYHYCRCPVCRTAVNHGVDNFVTRHIIKCARHLKSRGINRIFFWYDVPYRQGNFNEGLIKMFEDAGVKDDLVACWWWYDNPDLDPPLSLQRGNIFRKINAMLPSFVDPSVCLDSMSLRRELPPETYHTSSLARLLTIGKDAHSAGVLSYSHEDDYRYDEYCCLSEFSWNQEHASVGAFERRFTRFVLGGNTRAYEGIRGTYARLFAAFKGLVVPIHRPYHHRAEQPCHVGRSLHSFSQGIRISGAEWLSMIRSGERAARGLEILANDRTAATYKSCMLGNYANEFRRMLSTITCAYHILELARNYSFIRNDGRRPGRFLREMGKQTKALAKAIERHRTVMESIHGTRSHYTAPSVLLPMVNERRALLRFHQMFTRLCEKLQSGECGALPEMDFYHEAFAGIDRGYDPWEERGSKESALPE